MLSKVGDRVDIDLHIKDIVESNLEDGIRVKYPVCFECFDRILVNVDGKIKETEAKNQMYAE